MSSSSSGGGDGAGDAAAAASAPDEVLAVQAAIGAAGAHAYDARVTHALVEFAHRHTRDLLADAQSLAEHVGRRPVGFVERADVELAAAMRTEFVRPASDARLQKAADKLNGIPLTLAMFGRAGAGDGFSLPPDEYHETAGVYRVQADS